MGTHIEYRCGRCGVIERKDPQTCWLCGHDNFHEVLVYDQSALDTQLDSRKEEMARSAVERWNRKVRGEERSRD